MYGSFQDPELSSMGESGIVTFSKSTCIEQSSSTWSRTSSVLQVLLIQSTAPRTIGQRRKIMDAVHVSENTSSSLTSELRKSHGSRCNNCIGDPCGQEEQKCHQKVHSRQGMFQKGYDFIIQNSYTDPKPAIQVLLPKSQVPQYCVLGP